MSTGKAQLTVTTLGDVGAGKSTLLGHLLFQLGKLSPEKLNQLQADAIAAEKVGVKFAWAMDRDTGERERGITMSYEITELLQTPRLDLAIVDVPGHPEFLKSMIPGVALADCGLLVVSAAVDEFEDSFSDKGRIKDHALLAFALGLKEVVVVISKMDLVGFDEARFLDIHAQVGAYLRKVGFKPEHVQFVPISGWLGENLVTHSRCMPWYQQGLCLMDALDRLTPPSTDEADKPLRVSLNGVYNFKEVGTVLSGRVQSGLVKPGMTLQIRGTTVEVASVETCRQPMTSAGPGCLVGLNVPTFPVSKFEHGCVASEAASLDPAREVTEFMAQVVLLNVRQKVMAKYRLILHCHTARVPCIVQRVTAKLDRQTGKFVEGGPEHVSTGDACLLVMRPNRKLNVEVFREYQRLGRVVLRDGRKIVGVGIIKSTKKRTASSE